VSNRFVALNVDERPGPSNDNNRAALTNYLLDLKTGLHRQLDRDSELLATVDDEFVDYGDFGRSKRLALIHGLDTIRTFDIGEHNGATWNSKARVVILQTGWPSDSEGFNTVGLLNPETGAMKTVHLREPSELLRTCPMTGNFYTDQGDSINEYDSNGQFLRNLTSRLAVYSARCGYVLPFASVGLHGPEDWGVFDASSRARLMDFPWNEDEPRLFRGWNPRYDNLLLMSATVANTKTETIGIVDVREQRIVKSWPANVAAPAVWSGDGEAIVTFRDQHVVFEPLELQPKPRRLP
jgi:hypothetical protein